MNLKHFVTSVGVGIVGFLSFFGHVEVKAANIVDSQQYNLNSQFLDEGSIGLNSQFPLNYPTNTDPDITYPAPNSDWVEVVDSESNIQPDLITATNDQPTATQANNTIPKDKNSSKQTLVTSLVPFDLDAIEDKAQELYEENEPDDFVIFTQYKKQYDALLDSLQDENVEIEQVNLKIDALSDKYPVQINEYYKYYDIAGKKLNMMR